MDIISPADENPGITNNEKKYSKLLMVLEMKVAYLQVLLLSNLKKNSFYSPPTEILKQ